MWDNIKYFKPFEFESPDAPDSGEKMNLEFIHLLDKAREIAGIPFVINSGYRTPEHNKRVGGVVNSSHLTGHAADIRVVSDNARLAILKGLLEAGITRLGIGRNFIHADNDPTKSSAVWTYNVVCKDVAVFVAPHIAEISLTKSPLDWSHQLYRIEELHKLGFKGKGVRVAVLDTGIDLTHPSFAKAIQEGRLKAVDARTGVNKPQDANGHGCVTPDTLIHTTLCGMNRIDTFFNRVSELDKLVIKDELIEGSLTYELLDKLYTTSWNGSEFVKDQITHVHKFPYNGELIVVSTKDTTLKLTPWHPVYVVSSSRGKNLTVVKKRADELTTNDRILCANSTDINKENYRVVNNYILDEDLAYFAGLVFSDGHIDKRGHKIIFSNNDLNLLEAFRFLCSKLFNKDSGKEYIRNNCTTIEFYCKKACDLLENLGIPKGAKSKLVTLPELITKSPLSVIIGFYSGILDGDGNISDDRVRIITASETFCKETVELMRILGFNASYSINSRKGFKTEKESITYAIRMPNFDYIGYKKPTVKKSIRVSRSIVSISREDYSGTLYDLTVKENHNYVSGSGYIVSNTWCCSRFISDGTGALGFAPECSVLSLKVLNDSGSGSLLNVMRGIEMAMAADVHIISTSIGWPGKYSPFDELVNRVQAKGILWFSAAGNDGKKEDIDYPGMYDSVYSIGSHDNKLFRSPFSDWGKDLDFYGPGQNVKAAYLNKAEASLSGTSMATPSVAALTTCLYDYLISKYQTIDRSVLNSLVTCTPL